MAEFRLLACYAAGFALFWLPGLLFVRRLFGELKLPEAIRDLAALLTV